ncbi:MAG TPA: hypothetical protein VFC02_21895, partial [Anaerolineales bacterium]|nr:hypothetical protein [Anaerolineales bacterium]
FFLFKVYAYALVVIHYFASTMRIQETPCSRKYKIITRFPRSNFGSLLNLSEPCNPKTSEV